MVSWARHTGLASRTGLLSPGNPWAHVFWVTMRPPISHYGASMLTCLVFANEYPVNKDANIVEAEDVAPLWVFP
jgi:hypothetical protein